MKHIRLSLLAALILPAAILSSCGQKPLSDKEILTLIYEQTNGDGWSDSYKEGWLSENLADWKGVKIDQDGRVTELRLQEPKGVIPAEIAGLTELKKLAIIMQNKKGEDPENCFPAEIGNLEKLENLQLTSSVQCQAPSLAALPALKNLSLRCPGSAYPEIGSRNLEELTLNGFVGAIPAAVYEQPNLKKLVINPDKLEGGVSPNIADLTRLEHLQIDYSQFIGSVDKEEAPFPEEVFGMTSLKNIFLRGISTSGFVSPEIGDMNNLTYLVLSDLGLTGELPKEIGNMPKIETLEIYNNKISGSIPAELFNATTIKQLWLDHNELTGPIPEQIGNLVNLESIQLDNNHLTGGIPASLAKCVNLGKGVFLDFSKNNFSEEIPEAVKAMEKFEKFKF